MLPSLQRGFVILVVTLLLLGFTSPPARAICDAPELATLYSTHPEGGDLFGCSVDVNGQWAIVGAYADDELGYWLAGAAYLFDGNSGQLISKLLASGTGQVSGFGYAVEIEGDTAVIGAPGYQLSGTATGAAYLFDLDSVSQVAILLADDGVSGDSLGVAVAIDGTTVVVGNSSGDDSGTSSGSAYLFDVSTTTQIAKLLADDGAEDDRFGDSVDISGDTAIIGAARDDDNGSNSGAAYLFDVTTGSQVAKLLPDDGETGDAFGFAVGICGDTIIVGAHGDDDGGTNAGAVYIFDRVTTNQLAKFSFDGSTGLSNFGYDLDISGRGAIVGALDYGYYAHSGVAYLLDTETGTLLAQYGPYHGAPPAAQGYGRTVAFDGTTTIFGAPKPDPYAAPSGWAFLFEACPTIEADYTCQPDSGIVPFQMQMIVTLSNRYLGQTRQLAGRIDVSLAGGLHFSSWRQGYTNVAAGDQFVAGWTQQFPAVSSLVGDNTFTLLAEDVTPAPYNQPPYPSAGDTATAGCVVTGVAP